jgi:dolichol-phosphate mannosyltransferase
MVESPAEPSLKAFRALVLLSTAARLVFAAAAGLKYEEAYYWNYGQHLALSYFDHPPMVGWMARLSTGILGNAELFVRLPAILLFAGSLVLVHRVARELFDSRVALGAAVLMTILPAFEFYSMMLLPDAPLLFFWSLGLWCGHRLISEGNPRWWWGVGLATGLGMLSKYPAALIPLAPLLLALQGRRELLRRWELAGAALLAVLLFSPVLVWNAQNDWASLLYQGTSRMNEATSFQDRFGGSLLNQLLMLSPGGLLAVVWALDKALRRWRDPRFLYLLCACVPFLGLMLLVSTRRLVQMNWPLPGYVAATILLAALWSETGVWKHRRGLLALVLVPAALLSALPWLATLLEISALNRADDFSGWIPMGQQAARIRAEMPRPQQTFLAGHGYQAASVLAYYAGDPQNTLSSNILGEHAKGYGYWNPPERYLGWDAVYMVYERPESSGNWEQIVKLSSPDRLKSHFTRVEGPQNLTVFRGGKPLRRYIFYRCFDYLGP